MSTRGTVPDAWDEDWETMADKPEPVPTNEARDAPVFTKAERRAMHAEKNKEIWNSAENPEPMMFLQTRDSVPLQTSFKPNVTVLARKPPSKVLSRNNVTDAMTGLSLHHHDNYDEEDSEEERRRQAEQTFAERKMRAEKEREEKVRKYAEAREKIFGSPAPSSGESRGPSPGKTARGKGRGRGGRDNRPRSSNEQSPVRLPLAGKQLYDPSYSAKPDSVYVQKREVKDSRSWTTAGIQQPVREPRGPQGRGFAPRGNHSGSSI